MSYRILEVDVVMLVVVARHIIYDFSSLAAVPRPRVFDITNIWLPDRPRRSERRNLSVNHLVGHGCKCMLIVIPASRAANRTAGS